MEPLQSIVFTGHMIDLPDRGVPRFPSHFEVPAREWIETSLRQSMLETSNHPMGIASGARGGDILFHEVARSLNLNTTIILPFPPEEFIETSVTGAGSGNWEARFWALWNATPPINREVMKLTQERDPYAKCNSRMVEQAAARGPFHLIALWDGNSGDGPGGTADMVGKARAQCDEPSIISPNEL